MALIRNGNTKEDLFLVFGHLLSNSLILSVVTKKDTLQIGRLLGGQNLATNCI